jgi:hypothetical protein
VTVAEKRKCLKRLTWGQDDGVRMTDVDAPTIQHNVGVPTITQTVDMPTIEQHVGLPTIALSGAKQFTDGTQISCFT